MTDQRQLPQDLEAERALLGGMMDAPGTIDEVLPILSDPAAFKLLEHQTLFRAIVDLHEHGHGIDLVTVCNAVKKYQTGTPVGGWDDLMIDLHDAYGDPGAAEYNARVVKACHQRGLAITAAHALANEMYAPMTEPLTDPSEVAAAFAARLDDIAAGGAEQNISETAVDGILRLPGRWASPKAMAVTTGLDALDHLIDGFPRGGLSIIAAPTTVGKTSLALGAAVKAVQEGTSALFVSVELEAWRIYERIAASVGERPVRVMRDSSPSDQQVLVRYVAKELGDAAVLHVIDGVSNVRDIAAHIRIHVRRHDVGLVVVDHLHLCQPAEKVERRDLAIGSMTGLFKRLAVETDTAMVVPAQLNRESKETKGGIPQLVHLKESSSIEQDADLVVMLARCPDYEQSGGVALKVQKNRNGPTAGLPLRFHGPTMRFTTGVTQDQGHPVPEFLKA